MKNLLVVDDEIDILETIVDTLEIEFDDDSVQITKATNGSEALELFRDKGNFDLVVTDINMPEMDGVELTRNLKTIDKGIGVIVFTGHGDTEEQNVLNELGVISMIKKPYVEDLINEVLKAINS